MAAVAPQVIASCENTPANIQAHGQKREAPQDGPLAKRPNVMEAPAALYPKPIDVNQSVSYHRRMSALFHEMEAQIAGVPEEPVAAPEPLVVLDPEAEAEEALREEAAASKQATASWRKFNGLPEAEEPKPPIQAEWWSMPTPGRKLHKEHQKEWSKQGDDMLAKIEEQLEACGKVLDDCKPKDWWTMPTPARKNKRQSVANRAQRQDDLIKLMEEQLSSAKAVIKSSMEKDGKKVMFDTAAAFSDDEDEAMEEPEEAEAPKPKARWTTETLPLKKADTLAKMQKFAKKHKEEIGGVPKPRTKDAFWTALLAALRSHGLLA